MTSPVVAIIPARGGSKGVPRKNLRKVGGLPLIARAILSARSAEGIDRVVVSTDDAEIGAVAREWGAEVVDRPAELAGDTATSESAVAHALDVLEREGVRPAVVAFLQATSPFIDPRDLDAAIERVRDGGEDCVFSAIPFWGFLWEPGPDGVHPAGHDAAHRPRRQDRAPQFLETGAFYVMAVDGFQAAGSRFFGRCGVLTVDERLALEIDTEAQLELAAALVPHLPTASEVDVDALVTDFDGVHTDDSVLVDREGREQVAVSRTDGMGIGLLRRNGIPVLILSTETDPVVSARARKLGVEVRQGVADKGRELRDWAEGLGIDLSRTAYVGNDVNDLGCLRLVGWPIAVPDAHPLVIAAARVVLAAPGGRGAVREAADRILAARTRHLESRSIP
jgi:YrbI family 3-deoxy-D-manno-octulosonate 8-phosphate phosphatase